MATKIIVSLDRVPSMKHAKMCIEGLGAEWFKLGESMFKSDAGAIMLAQMAEEGHNSFLDLKLFNTETTKAADIVKAVCERWEPDMLSVRRGDWVKACVNVAASFSTVIIVEPGLTPSGDAYPPQHIERNGEHGFICRGPDAAKFRTHFPASTLVVPGIRRKGQSPDEHPQPVQWCNDADFVVIGRPIIRANNPKAAYAEFVEFGLGFTGQEEEEAEAAA